MPSRCTLETSGKMRIPTPKTQRGSHSQDLNRKTQKDSCELRGSVLIASSSFSLVRVDLVVGDRGTVVEDVDGGVVVLCLALDPKYSNPCDEGKLLDSVEPDEEPQSHLICTPLAILDLLDTKGSERSKWVNRQYRGICKLMGFPIDSHEQQCLDLLRCIEATRATKKRDMGSQKVIPAGSKGIRELKNLVSFVNYNGKQRGRC